MEPLTNYTDRPLEWLQPKALARSFELRSGDTLLAALAFRSASGTLATAETADGAWAFQRGGFLNSRVTLRRAGSKDEAGLYTPRFVGGGALAIIGGPALNWAQANFWATHWAFVDPNKNTIVRFTSGREKGGLSDIFKSQATVQVEPATAYRAWLPLLVALGMYLLILQAQDAASLRPNR